MTGTTAEEPGKETNATARMKPAAEPIVENLNPEESLTNVEIGDSGDATGQRDVVDWEGVDDPAKPLNWTNARKAKNIIVICYTTFLTCVFYPQNS